MTSRETAPELAGHPLFTNPHIRMCAVITAVMGRWEDEGERMLRGAYRELGHVTGEQMIARGVVMRGADLESYGRVSEQIMDICGLDGWTRLDTGRPEHATLAPRCAAYCEAYDAIGAPQHLCAIPFEWDNGCLDRINPGLEVWPTSCALQGADDCVYTIRPRPKTTALVSSPAATAVPPTAVAETPTWTNPQAGLYALVARTVAAFGPEGRAEVERALAELGAHTGRYLLREALVTPGCGATEAASLAGRLGAVAGFGEWEVIAEGDDAAALRRAHNSYLPVFARFEAPPDIQSIVAAWDRGWLEGVNPDLALEIRADRGAGDDADIHVFHRRERVE